MKEIDHLVFADKILDNSLWQWGAALFIFIIIFVVSLFVRNHLSKKLTPLVKDSSLLWNELLVEMISETKFFFILIVSLYMGLKTLNFPDRIHDGLNKAVVVVSLIQIAIWGSEMIRFWIEKVFLKKAEADSAAHTTVGFLGFLSKTILYTIVTLMVLSNLGVNITALVTGLGVGGIAIGLAVQNILGDLLSSLAIVLDKPFVVGDSIAVDGLGGTIEHIGLKTTRIRSNTSEQIIFSNADLLKSRIHNYRRMSERCVQFSVFTTYEASYEVLSQLPLQLRQIIGHQEKARVDRCHLKNLGNNGIEFEMVYFISNSDFGLYMDTQQKINLEIIALFRRQRLSFGFPVQNLHLDIGTIPDSPSVATAAPSSV